MVQSGVAGGASNLNQFGRRSAWWATIFHLPSSRRNTEVSLATSSTPTPSRLFTTPFSTVCTTPVDDNVVVYLLYVTAPGPVLSGLSSHSTLRPTRGGDHLPLTCRRHPQRGNRHRRTAPDLHLTWRSVQCTMPCWQQAQLLVVSWHSGFLFCDRSERVATSLLLLFRYEWRYSMMKEIPKQHFLPSKSPAHLQTFSVASPWWDCCTYSWM